MARRLNAAADARMPAWGDEVLRFDSSQVARASRISESRPHPPASVDEDEAERFEPDPSFAEWIRETFIAAGGPLSNEHHQHLLDARIGVLWTNVINRRQMRHVMATAEIPQVMGGVWKRGRAEQQMRDWFHFVPDFVLTFYAPEVATLDDRSFCALVEHELYHCAQAEDQYGGPKFDRDTGQPIYAMRGHDVSEFIGVVSRYGPTSRELRDMVDAASRQPTLNDAHIDVACGTCRRAA